MEIYNEKLVHIQTTLSSAKKEVIIALFEEVNQKLVTEDDNQEENQETESGNAQFVVG